MTLMAAPWHKTPCPGVYETYDLNWLFISNNYIILNLSDLCLGLKKIPREIVHFHYTTYKEIFKEIMHFYCMTNMATH